MIRLIRKMASYVVLVVLLFVSTCNCFLWPHVKTCTASYHFWRPFTGFIPPNAFLAGVDRDGDRKFISRGVRPDKKSWLSPTTISGKDTYQIYVADKEKGDSKIAEILCVNNPHNGFGWRATERTYINSIMKDCCLVEGGSGYKNGKRWVTYVGRAVYKNRYYVGGVTESRWWEIFAPDAMQFVDENGDKHGRDVDFEVLAYDCCTVKYCTSSNKADCCYDVV